MISRPQFSGERRRFLSLKKVRTVTNRRATIRVRLDADVVRDARETLGARSNAEAVDLAMTIALAISATAGHMNGKYVERLGSNRFRL